jgi:hypothetical protein
MPAYQTYSRLYFDEKIKDVLIDRWADECRNQADYDPDQPVTKPAISFQNKITRELYDAESVEVKEEVEKQRQKAFEEDSEDEGDEGDEDAKQRKVAMRRQKYVLVVLR